MGGLIQEGFVQEVTFELSLENVRQMDKEIDEFSRETSGSQASVRIGIIWRGEKVLIKCLFLGSALKDSDPVGLK